MAPSPPFQPPRMERFISCHPQPTIRGEKKFLMQRTVFDYFSGTVKTGGMLKKKEALTYIDVLHHKKIKAFAT